MLPWLSGAANVADRLEPLVQIPPKTLGCLAAGARNYFLDRRLQPLQLVAIKYSSSANHDGRRHLASVDRLCLDLLQ